MGEGPISCPVWLFEGIILMTVKTITTIKNANNKFSSSIYKDNLERFKSFSIKLKKFKN